MNTNEFVCRKCGDILRSWQIQMYREAISKGSSVSGAIRCARCGAVYSADDVAGVSQEAEKTTPVIKNILKEFGQLLEFLPELLGDFRTAAKMVGAVKLFSRLAFLVVFLVIFGIFSILIWWKPLGFLEKIPKLIFTVTALVIAGIAANCARKQMFIGRISKGDFPDMNTVNLLVEKNILQTDKEDCNYVYFNTMSEVSLKGHLKDLQVSDPESIMAIWSKTIS